MRRALRSLCLVPLLCLALAACGGKSKQPPDQDNRPAEPIYTQQEAAPGPAAAEAQRVLGAKPALLRPRAVD